MSPERRTALVSIGVAALLVVLKLVTGLATGSLGLISEAVHSGTDLVAALLTFFAIGVAARPADRGHAYGHGKADHLAALAEGAHVQTVEDGKELDAVQEAFIESSAFQCGFCTPGFVLMTRQLLDEHPDPNDEQIRHYLSGNLCRCAAYPEIIEAVKLAAKKRRQS